MGKGSLRNIWYRSVFKVLSPPLGLFLRKRYNVQAERSKVLPKDPSFIVLNHISDYDFIVINRVLPVYFRAVVTEAILDGRLARTFLPILTDFIYRQKGTRADAVSEEAKRTIADGMHVYLAPEGNVTQNGVTDVIRGRTGKLIKESKAGLVTIRVWGNYFAEPYWAKNRSNGPMFGELVRIYSKDEISRMSEDEINETLSKDLYFNHFEWIRNSDIRYDRECRAECMERVAFACPKCKGINVMHSKGDTLSCSTCGYSVDVDDRCLFTGDDVIFDNLYDWDIWQTDYLAQYVMSCISERKEIVRFDDVDIYRKDSGEKTYIAKGAALSIGCKDVNVSDGKTDMTFSMDKIISFSVSMKDRVIMNYDGDIYTIRYNIPASTRLPRMIFKLLRSSEN